MTLHLAPGLDVPIEYTTEAIAIIGRRGSGKTNTAVVAVEEMIGAGQQVVVVDTVGVWWGLRAGAAGGPNGLDVVIFGGQHADVPLEESAGKVIANAIVDHDLSAIIDTSLLSKAAARRFLLAFVTELYHRKTTARTPLHVVFDEADELAPQRSTPDTAKLLGAMEDFVRRGRSRGLGVTLVTQRPAVLNKDVLTQVEVLIAMQLTGPLDVKAVGEWVRLNASEDQGREVFSTLSSLQAGEGWVWSPSWLKVLQRVRFRKRHTFDSSVTPKIGEAVTRVEARIVDLTKLGEQIAATVEKAQADDPKVLRAKIAELERHIRDRAPEKVQVPVEVVREVEKRVDVPVLSAVDRTLITTARDLMEGYAQNLQRVLDRFPEQPPTPVRALLPTRQSAPRTPPPAPRAVEERVTARAGGSDESGEIKFRAGGQRMIETLGRMYPLHLTKAQWGTVSSMKTTSGTWSTYFGELKRAGFIDSDAAGFFLTDAGFDYLGGRPAPMTAEELQSHYRTILRAGAVRMLDAIMAAYPAGLGKDEIGEQIEMVTSSGTFSTYLGELVRNGLVEKDGAEYFATDILMKGAAA